MKKHLDRKIVLTDDGSHTIVIPELEENYHSTHGAIQESRHVFIKEGLLKVEKQELVIAEIGFGTGLNALLTLEENKTIEKKISYFTLEKYPLSQQEYELINFGEQLGNKESVQDFLTLHESEWEKEVQINANFKLHKTHQDLNKVEYPYRFDLVYFDAFAPQIQPDLWTAEVFEKLYRVMNPQGILVTYSAKGQVRRNLIAAGFIVKKVPGPPGKREMLSAVKE